MSDGSGGVGDAFGVGHDAQRQGHLVARTFGRLHEFAR